MGCRKFPATAYFIGFQIRSSALTENGIAQVFRDGYEFRESKHPESITGKVFQATRTNSITPSCPSAKAMYQPYLGQTIAIIKEKPNHKE